MNTTIANVADLDQSLRSTKEQLKINGLPTDHIEQALSLSDEILREALLTELAPAAAGPTLMIEFNVEVTRNDRVRAEVDANKLDAWLLSMGLDRTALNNQLTLEAMFEAIGGEIDRAEDENLPAEIFSDVEIDGTMAKLDLGPTTAYGQAKVRIATFLYELVRGQGQWQYAETSDRANYKADAAATLASNPHLLDLGERERIAPLLPAFAL